MTNVPKKVSQHRLDWRLYNPASPAICVVQSCTNRPQSATQLVCAEHQEIVDKLGKKNKPTTATYRRNVWSLVTTGRNPLDK
jgi:hypothetical protein